MSTANSSPLLIVGLGNPGKKYEKTRHNIGFMVIDALSHEARIMNHESRKKFDSEIIEIKNYAQLKNGARIILAKPQTYMNESGRAVNAIARFYKISLERIFIVYDDIDIPLGVIRERKKGSSGGHNGVQSIIDALGSNEFPRFRLGIGPVPSVVDPADFVLSPFTKDEQKTAGEMIKRAVTDIIQAIFV